MHPPAPTAKRLGKEDGKKTDTPIPKSNPKILGYQLRKICHARHGEINGDETAQRKRVLNAMLNINNREAFGDENGKVKRAHAIMSTLPRHNGANHPKEQQTNMKNNSWICGMEVCAGWFLSTCDANRCFLFVHVVSVHWESLGMAVWMPTLSAACIICACVSAHHQPYALACHTNCKALLGIFSWSLAHLQLHTKSKIPQRQRRTSNATTIQ